MSNAFTAGRVGLWVTDPANLDRLPKIAAFAGGMFTDIFLPTSATPAQMAAVRAQKRPDGTFLKAQTFAVPGKTEGTAVFAARVDKAIDVLKPGVVELDIERPDAELAMYLHTVVGELRRLRPTFLFRLNLEPFKGGYTPVDLIGSDDNLYVAAQTYYGDMSRVSEREVYDDALHALVPEAKFQLCYGAAAPDYQAKPDANGNYPRRACLPNWVYKGRFSGRPLAGGMVFSEQLLIQVGLL